MVKVSFQSVLSSLPPFPSISDEDQVLKLDFSPDVCLCLSHLSLHCAFNCCIFLNHSF